MSPFFKTLRGASVRPVRGQMVYMGAKNQKKLKMAFLQSACRGRPEERSFAPCLMRKIANFFFLPKNGQNQGPWLFQPPPSPRVVGAHTTPPPLGAIFQPPYPLHPTPLWQAQGHRGLDKGRNIGTPTGGGWPGPVLVCDPP